jgi:hypothetical protein
MNKAARSCTACRTRKTVGTNRVTMKWMIVVLSPTVDLLCW